MTPEKPIILVLTQNTHSKQSAYEYGPLSLAVLANDQGKVEYLVKHHPSTLSERNLLGHSPLQLAVAKPSCLRILVRAADQELLNHKDHFGMSAVEAAVQFSGNFCRNGRSGPECGGCGCSECVVILLEADCSVPQGSLESLLQGSSRECRMTYARHMKDRRERLVQFALDNLSMSDIEYLGLRVPGENIPVADTLAWRTAEFLHRRGIRVPDALAMGSPNSRHIPIYQAVKDPDDGDIFFQLGFRVDIPGLIMMDPVFWRNAQLPYIRWLSDHGIDPIWTELLPDQPDRTVLTGHMTMYKIGYWLGSELQEADRPRITDETWVRQCIRSALAIGPEEKAHKCRCRCLSETESCSPLTYFIKGHLGKHSNWVSVTDQVVEFALSFAGYLKLFLPDLTTEQHVTVLRYLTFSALDLPHTCCNPNGRTSEEFWPDHSPEDVREIEEEHDFVLGKLEQLVDEFGGQVKALLQDPGSGIAEIARFYRCTVVEKIEGVRKSLEGYLLSDDERRAAEDIGVVWDKRAVPARVYPPEYPRDENPFDQHTLEYWIYELEQIEVE